MTGDVKRPARFYFSLPRLLVKMRGGDARRSESNEVEAWVAGLASFSLSYLFFAALFLRRGLALWQVALVLVGIAFLIWLFWLLVLYINSLIIKLLQLCGLFQTIPIRRLQSVLLGIVATAMACGLLRYGSWIRGVGLLWLVAVALNLASALVLVLSNGAPTSGE